MSDLLKGLAAYIEAVFEDESVARMSAPSALPYLVPMEQEPARRAVPDAAIAADVDTDAIADTSAEADTDAVTYTDADADTDAVAYTVADADTDAAIVVDPDTDTITFTGVDADTDDAPFLFEPVLQQAAPMQAADYAPASWVGDFSAIPGVLADRLDNLDESFAQTVLRLIDERGMTDVEVYKRANMSRQLFAKIRKDGGYRPTKRTACALVFALGLDLDDADALLKRAGFTLSHSSKFDIIVEYFLMNDVHDIFQVNEALYAYDQPLLG